jgi:hypothetical protein
VSGLINISVAMIALAVIAGMYLRRELHRLSRAD